MSTMNKYFRNVFVINRGVDIHRMDTTHSILSRNNIKYSRFEAIVIDKETHLNVTNEMLGCALSHINIWKKIVDNKMKNALIFEDDIMLVDDWKERLNKSMTDIPENWDILTLGNFGIKDHSDKYTSPFNFILYTIVSICNLQNKKHKKLTDNIIIPYFFTGLYGYAVSYKGAKKLLSLINNKNDITFHIDVLISCKSEYLNIYSIKDDIVYQRIEDSTINTRNTSVTTSVTTSKNKNNKNTTLVNSKRSDTRNLKIHFDLLKLVDNKNIKYNYYMNVPVYKLRCINGYNVIVNGWLILFTLLLVIITVVIILKKLSFKL